MTPHALAVRSPADALTPHDRRHLDDVTRRMVARAVSWLRDHPLAHDRFAGYPHASAIVYDESATATALLRAVSDAAGPMTPTRELVQLALTHAFAVERDGWAAYETARSRARRGL